MKSHTNKVRNSWRISNETIDTEMLSNRSELREGIEENEKGITVEI
jgi:hypothetical protein